MPAATGARALVSMADFEPGPEFFDALSPAPDAAPRRALVIGPFSIQLEDLSPAHLPGLEDRYLGFVERHPPPGSLRLSVRPAGVPRFLDRPGDEEGIYQLRARPHGSRILLYGHDFAGWFDSAGGAGVLAVCGAGWEGLEVPLENFLRVYCAWQAVDRKGFMIHGASIVREGRAYVFFGHSGAGKTTVSTLSKDLGFVLSDDLTLITREGSLLLAHSVPFRGLFRQRVVSERRTFPVAALCRLIQAPHERVQALPHARGVTDVFSCLPFVTDHLLPRDPAQMMLLLDEVLRGVPVLRLEFTRSTAFWEPLLSTVTS